MAVWLSVFGLTQTDDAYARPLVNPPPLLNPRLIIPCCLPGLQKLAGCGYVLRRQTSGDLDWAGSGTTASVVMCKRSDGDACSSVAVKFGFRMYLDSETQVWRHVSLAVFFDLS